MNKERINKMISKGNKKERLTWIDIEPMSAIVIIGLLAALIGPEFRRIAPKKGMVVSLLPFAFSILGLIFLIIAKISLFRQGIWSSFGSKLMTRGYAKLYKLSYIFMGIGALFFLYWLRF
jgi:hypothetical protein